MKSKFYPICLLLLLLIFSNRLQAATLFQEVGIASSPNPVGSGARAMGIGGAFIAIADDATAASWNPGGLIQVERPEMSIVGAYFHRKRDFSSHVHPETNNKTTIDDHNINYFSATYPFEFLKRNLVISINYQRLYEFKRRFDYHLDLSSSGVKPSQDKHFSQKGVLSALGLASAIQITPRLSFGMTLNIWTDELFWSNGWEENFNERSVGEVGGVPVIINTSIKDKYSRFGGINTNLGLLWDISDYLTIGAVAKTPFRASIRHEFKFETRSTFDEPVNTTISSLQNIREDVKLLMPLSYGIGIAWRLSDALSFAFDVYRTEWSKYVLTDAEGNSFSPINGSFKSESNIKDTTQIRIGGEYLIIGKRTMVSARGGVFYDPEPCDNSPEDFYGIAIGSGIVYKKIIFDMAYQFRWGHNINTGNLIANSNADVEQHQLLSSVIIHF